MQNQNNKKYFWDYTNNCSDKFKLIRLFEYASFPDLLKISFELVKKHILEIDINKLRTSESRKKFLQYIKENFSKYNSWEEIILD